MIDQMISDRAITENARDSSGRTQESGLGSSDLVLSHGSPKWGDRHGPTVLPVLPRSTDYRAFVLWPPQSAVTLSSAEAKPNNRFTVSLPSINPTDFIRPKRPSETNKAFGWGRMDARIKASHSAGISPYNNFIESASKKFNDRSYLASPEQMRFCELGPLGNKEIPHG